MTSTPASSVTQGWAPPLVLLLDFSYSVRIFLKISFIYFFVITKSWFLYYFYYSDNNYTNKCQLVTVLSVLLLSPPQVHSCQPQARLCPDTWENAAHVTSPCTSRSSWTSLDSVHKV